MRESAPEVPGWGVGEAIGLQKWGTAGVIWSRHWRTADHTFVEHQSREQGQRVGIDCPCFHSDGTAGPLPVAATWMPAFEDQTVALPFARVHNWEREAVRRRPL